MENIADSNLSVFEDNTSDELSFEELESVAGGCGEHGGGGDSIPRQLGHVAGDIVAAPVKAVGDFVGGFVQGLWD